MDILRKVRNSFFSKLFSLVDTFFKPTIFFLEEIFGGSADPRCCVKKWWKQSAQVWTWYILDLHPELLGECEKINPQVLTEISFLFNFGESLVNNPLFSKITNFNQNSVSVYNLYILYWMTKFLLCRTFGSSQFAKNVSSSSPHCISSSSATHVRINLYRYCSYLLSIVLADNIIFRWRVDRTAGYSPRFFVKYRDFCWKYAVTNSFLCKSPIEYTNLWRSTNELKDNVSKNE